MRALAMNCPEIHGETGEWQAAGPLNTLYTLCPAQAVQLNQQLMLQGSTWPDSPHKLAVRLLAKDFNGKVMAACTLGPAPHMQVSVIVLHTSQPADSHVCVWPKGMRVNPVPNGAPCPTVSAVLNTTTNALVYRQQRVLGG